MSEITKRKVSESETVGLEAEAPPLTESAITEGLVQHHNKPALLGTTGKRGC